MGEVLHNILIESGIPIKLARLIKTRINETYSTHSTTTHLCNAFESQNYLNKEIPRSQCFPN